MRSKESKNAAGKTKNPEIIRCWRCGAEFASIEGIKIMDGMILQKARCPVCRNDVRSMRPYTVAHGIAFSVGVGIVLAGSGMKPVAFGKGTALYSPEQQAESRKSGK